MTVLLCAEAQEQSFGPGNSWRSLFMVYVSGMKIEAAEHRTLWSKSVVSRVDREISANA